MTRLYYGTTDKKLLEILREGFKPHDDIQYDSIDDYLYGKPRVVQQVCFTEDLKVAEIYANRTANHKGGTPMIIELETPTNEMSSATFDLHSKGYVTTKTVPPTEITRVFCCEKMTLRQIERELKIKSTFEVQIYFRIKEKRKHFWKKEHVYNTTTTAAGLADLRDTLQQYLTDIKNMKRALRIKN